MQARRPFCRGFVIRRRIQRSTGKVDGEIAIRFVLVYDENFRSHYSARLNSTPHLRFDRLIIVGNG